MRSRDTSNSARVRSAVCSAAARRRSARRSCDDASSSARAASAASTSAADALLPAVVALQPFATDVVDELGHDRSGEPLAEGRVGLHDPSHSAQHARGQAVQAEELLQVRRIAERRTQPLARLGDTRRRTRGRRAGRRDRPVRAAAGSPSRHSRAGSRHRTAAGRSAQAAVSASAAACCDVATRAASALAARPSSMASAAMTTASSIRRPAGDHQPGGGVEHDDVAVSARLAVEHPAHGLGVLRRHPTDELLVGGRREAERRPGRP